MRFELDKTEGNPLDPHGVGALLKRLDREVSQGEAGLSGFRFLQEAREMLAHTREIEEEHVRGDHMDPLYVGFQNAVKAEAEIANYESMLQFGASVVAFGVGELSDEGKAVFENWHELEPNRSRIENQWYLATMSPAPIAFVGWEVSPDELWGRGGATTVGKEFAGFVSDDARVVQAIIRHLEAVRAGEPSGADLPASLSLIIKKLRPKRLLRLVDDGKRPQLSRSSEEVEKACKAQGSELYLYDLAAASYLVDPYPSYEKRWRRPLDAKTLRGLGRGYLADQVEGSQEAGVRTEAILPSEVGFAHLAHWCSELDVDLVVLPFEYTRPSLIARLQGLTLEALRSNVDSSIVVDDPEAGSWLVSTPDSAKALVD